MIKLILAKLVLHTKLLISGFLLTVSSVLGIAQDNDIAQLNSLPKEIVVANSIKPTENAVVKNSDIPTPIYPSITPPSSRKATEIPNITSIMISTPKPTPTPSYNDMHCPKIIRVQDSLGNNSNDINGLFKRGEISSLRLTVTAEDPKGLPLYYRFDSLGIENTDQRSITSKDWSQDNFIDINTANVILGTKRYISVSIDNRDGYSCYGSHDLYTTAFYDVVP